MEQLLNAGSFEPRNLNFQEITQLGHIFWKNYSSHIYSKYAERLSAGDFYSSETSSLKDDYDYALEVYKLLK